LLARTDGAARRTDADELPSPAELYRLHAERVYRRCLSLTQDPELAEDVLQDVFVRLHEKRETIEDPVAALAWLLRVADRLCLDRLHRERTLWRRIRDTLASSPPPPVGPPGGTDREKLLEEVRRSFADLPVKERAAVVMKYVEGERQNVIARRLSCSEGQVSKLLSRAISRLRSRGWECDHG
jgi:RNA polymerase sigma factor (sigma-70 family)